MKQQILTACRRFLPPIVRLLLRNGVNWKDFQDLAKGVYVEVARQDYGIGGRPTNNARVAMLTGLSRHEVAHIRKRNEAGAAAVVQTSKSRMTEILTGWHMDPDFVTAGGKPRVLDAGDEKRGFPALLKRFAGDMPPVAVTKEMLQLGVMERAGDDSFRALKRDYVHTTLSPDLVTYMGDTLHDHAATLEFNLNPERKKPAMFERRASNLNLPRAAVKKFFELVEQRGLEFLDEMDVWLSRHEEGERRDPPDRHTRTGVGVYVFHEDIGKGKRL